MNAFITIVMYLLWGASLLGILVATFTKFQYADINMIVLVLLMFTLINSLFTRKA